MNPHHKPKHLFGGRVAKQAPPIVALPIADRRAEKLERREQRHAAKLIKRSGPGRLFGRGK